MNLTFPTSRYYIVEDTDTKRLKESWNKFKEALEQDAKEERERGSGLPKDWRSRILTGGK